MGLRPKLACLVALAAIALALAACGGGQSNPTEGLLSNIDKANGARTLASLQQGLITIQTAAAESGAPSAGTLAATLQRLDPSHTYRTAPPTDVGVVQVLGGGGTPVMLVGISSPPNSPRPPYYLAAWVSNGSTLFYAGQQPPVYSSSPPSAPGWSQSPPQI